MFPAITTLRSLVKTKSYHIDYPLFRLHYQATVLVLLTFCVLITAKVMFGDPIDCSSRGAGMNKFHDNVCFSQGTYTRYARELHYKDVEVELDEKFIKVPKVAGINKAKFSPSVKYLQTGMLIPESTDLYVVENHWQTYYPYIPVMLFVQAVFFYFPHYLWKNWENGLIASICKQLHEHRTDPTNFFETNHNLIYHLQASLFLNKSLVYKYYFCHMLLLLNLVLQIVAMDFVFNHQFISYGIDALWYYFVDKDIYGLRIWHGDGADAGPFNSMDLNSPLDFVFPKITACTFETLSQAGLKPEVNQFICVLPLNLLHDKFYLIFWFWLAALLVVTVLQILLDMMTVFFPPFRGWWFRFRFGNYTFEASPPLPEVFLLSLIGSNSDKFAFSALLKRLSKENWTGSPPSDCHSVV